MVSNLISIAVPTTTLSCKVDKMILAHWKLLLQFCKFEQKNFLQYYMLYLFPLLITLYCWYDCSTTAMYMQSHTILKGEGENCILPLIYRIVMFIDILNILCHFVGLHIRALQILLGCFCSEMHTKGGKIKTVPFLGISL